MADTRSLRGPRDRQRIDVNEPYELRYWCEKFGVGADELRRAVAEAGPMVGEVERHLGKPPAPTAHQDD